MLIDIFILIIFAMGTISSAINAVRADSAWRMLFWEFASGLDLIITIQKAIQIFA